MAYSSGTFSRIHSWVTDRDNGVKIRADRMDAEFDGMATGLSTAILKDGTQTITANIPFAGFKLTGIGAAASNGDAVRYEQITDGTFSITVANGTLKSTDAGAGAGPTLTLHRDSASPADDDVIGEIKFDGEDDGSAQTTYGCIYAQAKDVTDATEDGAVFGQAMVGGTLTTIWQIDASGFHANDPADPTKQILFDASGITTGTKRTLTMPDADATLAGLNVAQTFTGAQSFRDTAFFIIDNDDATKRIRFELSGIATGQDRVWTVPDSNVTVTSTAATLLDDTSTSAMRTTLGVVIGTDVQAYDADTTKNDAANIFTARQTFSVGGESLTIKTSGSGQGPGFIRYKDSGGSDLAFTGFGASNATFYMDNGVGGISIDSAGTTSIDADTQTDITAGANGVRSSTIYAQTTASAANVNSDSSGLLRRSTSSERYKTDVEDADYALSLDAVLKSRPVWYRSTCRQDNQDWSHWGFIAEEVAEIDPRLVHWGYPYKEIDVVREVVTGYTGKGKSKKPIIERNVKKRSVPDETQPLQPEGVAYERYVVHLVAVVAKQEKLIAKLNQRIAALENA